MDQAAVVPTTGAQALLLALKECGVRYLFANAGTDFAPVIEAYAQLPAEVVPEPLTIPHETAAVAMAHGYWLATGELQALMVHVNVGLANAAMGVINAASDDIPLIVLSGRTPITETGRPGGRATPIQYGQEMYDQTSLVRDAVKFDYEIRYPEQADTIIKRAVSIAVDAPAGPVYVSLPREPLTETLPSNFVPARTLPKSSTAAPNAQAIETLTNWLAEAETPVILCQRGDVKGRLAEAVSSFAARQGIEVVEPFTVRNLLGFDDPALAGYDPKTVLPDADLVIVLDSAIPWIEAQSPPKPTAKVAHIAVDPHVRRMPVRGYRSDLSIAADTLNAIEALSTAAPKSNANRAKAVAERSQLRKERVSKIGNERDGRGSPMSAAWLSHCVSEIMDESAIAFSELGLLPEFMRLKGPNRLFTNVHAGGLGWAMPAALGAQLADRDRLAIACMGDGSYMFANPVVCHQIAEALELPILTIVKNNRMWNAVRRSVVNGFPNGTASALNRMPLTSLEPLPDFCAVARASRAHAERVEHGDDLPTALERALQIVRTERRQVLLDVNIAAGDRF